MKKQKEKELKLITITRSDIPDGYQVVQTGHSIADFAYEYPTTFREWKETSNSIISLSAKNKDHLMKLYDKLSRITLGVILFEPDIDDYTSICLFGTPDIRKKLSNLPLSLRKEVKYV